MLRFSSPASFRTPCKSTGHYRDKNRTCHLSGVSVPMCSNNLGGCIPWANTLPPTYMEVHKAPFQKKSSVAIMDKGQKEGQIH